MNKDRKFPIKIRHIWKTEQKNCISISVFDYENKEKYSNLCAKTLFRKACWFTIERIKGKRCYVLIKDFNTLLHNHTLHDERQYFCRYCLQAFSTAKTLKFLVDDFFTINGKTIIKKSEKDKYVKYKDFERRIKLVFMIYTYFEINLMPEDNGK